MGRGVDVAIEAVGIPETFDLCQKIIGVDGTVATVVCMVNQFSLIWTLFGFVTINVTYWIGFYQYNSSAF